MKQIHLSEVYRNQDWMTETINDIVLLTKGCIK